MTISFLAKILPKIVYPLDAAIIISSTALVVSFTPWKSLEQVLLGFALAGLCIAAAPSFSNWLNFRLEAQFPPVTVAMLPRSDVVILLGGALGQPFPPRVAADLGDPADRIMEALRIYHAGKVSFIVISAGPLHADGAVVPESQLIADLLVELGVPHSALVLESRSRTTRENAVNTAAIFEQHGWRTGLLVTSGAHMPRALAAFQKVGLDVTPASTDIHARPQSVTLLGLFPDVGALARTTTAIKEMMGLWVYRYRGWA